MKLNYNRFLFHFIEMQFLRWSLVVLFSFFLPNFDSFVTFLCYSKINLVPFNNFVQFLETLGGR